MSTYHNVLDQFKYKNIAKDKFIKKIGRKNNFYTWNTKLKYFGFIYFNFIYSLWASKCESFAVFALYLIPFGN